MPLTFGIIGCGNILRLHWPGLQSAKAKIKWTCDLRAEAAQAWAQTCQAKPTTDWRTVIEDPEVQALDITASSAAHKEICLAAIEQGKAVICEKTLATTAEDAWEIVAQAEKRRTIFYTSYMKRFLPAVRQAKELLAEMGDIVSTHIRTHQPWGIPWREVPPDSWLAGTNRSPSKCRQAYGGGVLVCAGSHMLDLLCFFLGRPRRVAASLHIPKGADTDLFAAAFFETDNGVAHFEAFGHSHSRIGGFRDGWEETIEIIAEKGRLKVFTPYWDRSDVKPSLLIHYDEKSGTETEYRYPAESPFIPALVSFCQNIARGEQGEQPRTTGYEVDELIAHIIKSAEAKQMLEIAYRINIR